MLFSVVIPTHNRLNLLKDAVKTVLQQRRTNWELVIFDNGSTDPIAAYVDELKEPRIKFDRSDAFLPVEKSWNRAVDMATGDYVTVLGDDDGLVPDHIEVLEAIIAKFSAPELIYSAFYQFFFPGVAPWERRSYVLDLQVGFFFTGRAEPFRLTRDQATFAVASSMGLRGNFSFNIQAQTMSRALLARLRQRGPIFQSPFPDYYLANVVMLAAQAIVVNPTPVVICGVSKESYGFALYNNLYEKGDALLNSNLLEDPEYRRLADFILPGNTYNTKYVITMSYIAQFLQTACKTPIDLPRYRKLQINEAVKSGGFVTWRNSPLGKTVWPLMTMKERIWAIGLAGLYLLMRRIPALHRRLTQRLGSYFGLSWGFVPRVRYCDVGSYSSVSEVFQGVREGRIGYERTAA